jgi:imidazolonepropionase-like amidohydrolase
MLAAMLRRAAAVLLCAAATVLAQGPPHNGPEPADAAWFALVNGKVVAAPGLAPVTTTLVIRNGSIVAVGGDVPAGATQIDCTGLWIYPGLVEPFLPIDVPALDPATGDQHWHPMVQAPRSALEGAPVPTTEREALWALGYTTAGIAPSGGILKGTGSVVLLDEPTATERPRVVRARAFAVASLQTSRSGHPSSEMGAIGLLRQMLLDARWYERCAAAVTAVPALAPAAPQPSAALQALVDQRTLPLWFDTIDELQALRALRLAAEFERAAVVVGSGMEFRRLAALAAAKAPIVVPLHFPEAPDVGSATAADRVSLRHLQSWEQAPTNSKRLLDAGVAIAWTTARLRDKKDLRARMRDAIACGVTVDQALAALTTVPATLLGVADRTGTIAPGKLGNLLVASGELFGAETTIREVWVGGRRHALAPATDRGLDGTWALAGLPGGDGAATVTIQAQRVLLQRGDEKLAVGNFQRHAHRLTFTTGTWAITLYGEGSDLAGTARDLSGGAPSALRGNRTGPADNGDTPRNPAQKPFEPPAPDPLPTPLGGYGLLERPAATTFAIVGADLWTSDGRGVLRNGAVLVRDGKITFVGPREDLPALPPGAATIDASGKHLTPGLIDCHSHTGISRGINEGGQAVTAEVRIADVVDPDDVNWYRQLAGGVTTMNLLHGSANPIGGQSCTVKNRWGAPHPDELQFAGAPPGIKFALGENPRRANDGAANPRYPNTRMGVEGLLRDRFAAAEAYQKQHAAYTALAPAERAKVLPPRIDLELQALAEVLAGRRLVHCHSYRQDEIFMLCQLAQEHGFRVGTFQHVLEGYKVADAIAQNAIGASSFSDWWAYKFEVYDAIPDNGAILREQGVVVSFNSDSNEHARRLNTEAGKAVKYGGVPPAEALCFVTRNPAIQLGIFDRTGSLTVGKDADLALWSGYPLSYASRCEATWVDGRLAWSLPTDRAAVAAIAAQRARLLQKALAAGAETGKRPKATDDKDAYWAAEDLTADYCCRDHEGGR